MPRVGPATILSLQASVTYLLGGTEVARDVAAEGIVYNAPGLPPEVWHVLLGKKAGEQAVLEPAEPFSLAESLGHEIYPFTSDDFDGDLPKEGDEFPLEEADGDQVTVTVVKVDPQGGMAYVSPNPLALHPIKRAVITVVAVEGGQIIDGNQVDPESRIQIRELTVTGRGNLEAGVYLRREVSNRTSGLVLPKDGQAFIKGTGLAVNDGSNTGVDRGLWLWHGRDSNHVIYSANPGGKSPANKPVAKGWFSAKGHRFRLRTYHGGEQGFLFENSREQALVDIDAATGKLWARGGLYSGSSDVYFPDGNHDHTALGNQAGWAAIENSKNFGGLMILGRTVTTNPLLRVVKVWDVMEVHGTFKAKRTAAFSDARLKEEVTDLEHGLSAIEKLRPVSFRWKEDDTQTKTYGLIAQEVREVLPETVEASHEEDGMLDLSYQELVPVLINAVKELSAKVAALEAKLADGN